MTTVPDISCPPQASDVLVATVDPGGDGTINPLVGDSSVIDGVQFGYQSGSVSSSISKNFNNEYVIEASAGGIAPY